MTTTAAEPGVYIAAISAADMFADPTYQRVLDVHHARRMSASWDRRLAGIIEVSDRGPDASPRYAVIDGQHRWAAARYLADPPQLVANVHEGLTVAGEAELFDKLNRQRKQMTTWDHWKARRTAGDPLVAAIEHTVIVGGLKVVEGGGASGGVACVASLEKIATSAGGLGLLADTLDHLAGAWSDLPVSAFEAPLVLGVALVLDTFADLVDGPTLSAALAEVTPRKIRVDAAALRDHGIMSGSLGKLVAVAIVNRYNRRAATKRLTFPDRWKGVLSKPVAAQQHPTTTADPKPLPPPPAPTTGENIPGNIPTTADYTTTLVGKKPDWLQVASALPSQPLTVPDSGPPRRDDDLAELIDRWGDTIIATADETTAAVADQLGLTERQVRRMRTDLGVSS